MPSQALLHSRRFVLTLRAAFLIGVWCLTAAASVQAQTPAATPSRDATPDTTGEDRQLNEARRQNEEAQAEYYRTQTRKLNEPPPSKSFWRTLSDNAAILGALTAALVALFTLIVNQRTALRARKDTEFYEALKRFGDKDSPTVRASAAAILTEMSDTTFFAWRWRRNGPWWRPEQRMVRYPYFDTVLDQLITGLLLEEDSVVVHSIFAALKRIMSGNFTRSADRLREANWKLQQDITTHLMEFQVAKGATSINELTTEAWSEAESLTGSTKPGLQGVLSNVGGWYWTALFVAQEAYKLVEDTQKLQHMRTLQGRLVEVGRRLRQNVELCAELLHARSPQASEALNLKSMYLGNIMLIESNLQYIDFTRALFSFAYCEGAKFKGACLEETLLTRAVLTRTELSNANLYHAQLSDPLEMYEANWWQADFAPPHRAANAPSNPSSQQTPVVDEKLIEKLISQYGELSPAKLKEAHPSVKTYVAKRNRLREEEAANQKIQPPPSATR